MALGRKVKLNAAEVALVDYVSMVRYRIDQDAGATDRQMSPRDPVEIMRDGYAGELAACRVFNVYPDMSLHPTPGSHDFVTVKGTKCDVKTRPTFGDLLVPVHKKGADVDVYILVIGSGVEFEVVGWAYSWEVFNEENLTDLGHGPTYLVKKNELRLLGGGNG